MVSATDEFQKTVKELSEFASKMEHLVEQPLPDSVNENINREWMQLQGSIFHAIANSNFPEKANNFKEGQKKVRHFRDKYLDFFKDDQYSWLTEYAKGLQFTSDASRAFWLMFEEGIHKKKFPDKIEYIYRGIKLLACIYLDYLNWLLYFNKHSDQEIRQVINVCEGLSKSLVYGEWGDLDNADIKIKGVISNIKIHAKSILVDSRDFYDNVLTTLMYPDAGTCNYMERQGELFDQQVATLSRSTTYAGMYVCFEDGNIIAFDSDRAVLAKQMRQSKGGMFFIEKVPSAADR